MGAVPGRVVVAVLTYRRPDDLEALLPMLAAQLDRVDLPASVLVVDNDPAAGARGTVEGRADPRFRYVHEPVPGIAAGRNRALDEAEDADLLVFIDDDERPVEGWLQALLDVRRSSGAAGVVGPVVSTMSGELDPWISEGGFFRRRTLPTGTDVTVAATNNLLLDLRALRDLGLRFDPGLGLIGGSDTLFTRQLTGAGRRLVWCAEAVVTDVVPADRMTRRWVVRRAFRMGTSASLVEVRIAGSAARRLRARCRQAALGGSRLAAGVFRLTLGLVTASRGRRAAGVRNLARGLGLVLGAFGYAYAEYRRAQPAPAVTAA